MCKTTYYLKSFLAVLLLTAIFSSLISCKNISAPTVAQAIPHDGDWGIYELDLPASSVKLLYSSSNEIYTSALRLNNTGDKFVFAQKVDGTADKDYEIFSMGMDGSNLLRLTNNSFCDLYPAWS